jgi:hypothetical protein
VLEVWKNNPERRAEILHNKYSSRLSGGNSTVTVWRAIVTGKAGRRNRTWSSRATENWRWHKLSQELSLAKGGDGCRLELEHRTM